MRDKFGNGFVVMQTSPTALDEFNEMAKKQNKTLNEVMDKYDEYYSSGRI